MGVTWLAQVTFPTRDQGKGHSEAQKDRPEETLRTEGLGGRGVSERGELSRIPGQGRERSLSGSRATEDASRAQGEAEERGAHKPPRLIELYVVQKG